VGVPLDQLARGVIITDGHGGVTEMNRAAEQILRKPSGSAPRPMQARRREEADTQPRRCAESLPVAGEDQIDAAIGLGFCRTDAHEPAVMRGGDSADGLWNNIKMIR
jgi:PAS domain-containing protein